MDVMQYPMLCDLGVILQCSLVGARDTALWHNGEYGAMDVRHDLEDML